MQNDLGMDLPNFADLVDQVVQLRLVRRAGQLIVIVVGRLALLLPRDQRRRGERRPQDDHVLKVGRQLGRAACQRAGPACAMHADDQPIGFLRIRFRRRGVTIRRQAVRIVKAKLHGTHRERERQDQQSEDFKHHRSNRKDMSFGNTTP
ncbi:MAG: hypothetical protein QM811_15260 [Pirellulales bacterium]